MKKVFFTAFAAMAFAFAMTACNNNQPAEAVEDTTVAVAEECEHHCMHEGDSAAMCCKAEGAAEEHACCAKEGEHRCAKAEGKECEHKCAKEGEHKCCKAEGKECEHKCQK